MGSPEVCVLKTDGINCEEETAHAFAVAGATPEVVHLNQLRSAERRLGQYSILAIPGGFSYGDDIASGKVLATELISYLSDQLHDFVERGKPIIGICNGFQALVRTGLLPSGRIGQQQVTLTHNQTGHFGCRWVDLAVADSVCRFARAKDFEQQPLPMQVAHGEGRFLGGDAIIQSLIANRQVVFRYAAADRAAAASYPDNPNGSIHDIAGICDPSGMILGMMPHPERSMAAFHPYRVRTETAQHASRIIFNNIVAYAKEM